MPSNEHNPFIELIANTKYTLLTPAIDGFACNNSNLSTWFPTIELKNGALFLKDLLASNELSETNRTQLEQFVGTKTATDQTQALLIELSGGRMLRWLWLNPAAYLMVEDVTDCFSELQRLLIASHIDPLTGLANRRQFNLDFERLYTQNLRSGQTGALVLFDLNGFKAVNDQLGHATGDKVLAEFGKLAKPLVRPYECLARIGGDEFAVITAHSGDIGAIRIQSAMQKALTELTTDIGLEISASFGVALFGEGHNAPGDKYQTDSVKQLGLLFSQADADLYKSKAICKNKRLNSSV
jgi:diguanylate cyclase (GGDEF)-like protein